jgi:DNA-directed RNA polymerase specialized sigma24 family protein
MLDVPHDASDALGDAPQREIAQILGITETNVAVRLNRARAALKRRLGETHYRQRC